MSIVTEIIATQNRNNHDSLLWMYVLCMRRQMTVVYGTGVLIKFPTTRRLSIIRDPSIRDGRTGWDIHGVNVNCTNPIIPQQLSRIGQKMSMWSNLVVFRYWKWRIRRTCHYAVYTSCSGVLIWKTVVTRPRAYRVGSIGYATSSRTVLTQTWGLIALYLTWFTPKFV